MTRDDISSMLREACDPDKEDPWGNGFWRITHKELEKFTELLEEKIRAEERNALFAALEKLRDESHTILGASDDYKQGREMGIQLCINELTRGEK